MHLILPHVDDNTSHEQMMLEMSERTEFTMEHAGCVGRSMMNECPSVSRDTSTVLMSPPVRTVRV